MTGYKRQRGPGTWRLEVSVGFDAQGKPKRYTKTVHCKSEAEADRELALFYSACVEGRIRRQNTEKLGDFCDVYYKEYAERYLKTSTLASIRTTIKIYIKPLLGNKRITKISRVDIQKWVNKITDTGKRPKTVQNHYQNLRQIMNYAVDMDVIDENPCKRIKLPKNTKREISYYGIDEVRDLLKALDSLDNLTLKTAILILLFGGLRKGELLGLNWDDVDFKTNQIHIHRTRMVEAGKGLYEDTPKTASSVRYVGLPPEVMTCLAELKKTQESESEALGSMYESSPAVLRGSFGAPLYPSVFHRQFERFIKDSGLPRITLHGLRHTHASMLAHMNTDKMQISERLGHSELSTTLNIYTHLFENADKKIAENLQTIFLDPK